MFNNLDCSAPTLQSKNKVKTKERRIDLSVYWKMKWELVGGTCLALTTFWECISLRSISVRTRRQHSLSPQGSPVLRCPFKHEDYVGVWCSFPDHGKLNANRRRLILPGFFDSVWQMLNVRQITMRLVNIVHLVGSTDFSRHYLITYLLTVSVVLQT